MIDHGKRNVLGVLVDAVDYDAAVARVREAAIDGRGYGVSALAVHGVMTGVDDDEHRYRLNHLDMVTPDGQPVRWALSLQVDDNLPDRVYGPELMRRLCDMAAEEDLPVFLYGSTADVLARLEANLVARHPGLVIAGTAPSRFRRTTAAEQIEIATAIRESGARLTFVGLGCPRQEVFAHEYRDLIHMPVVAVGAAFDYHAGTLREPPAWMQRTGLQWAHRLAQDPRRLWHRYTVLNVRYLGALALQRLRVRVRPTRSTEPTGPVRWG